MTRHSKQIPMPHSGPRGSPVTERRKLEIPHCRTAAATVVPDSTATAIPFTETWMISGIHMLPRATRRQIGFNGNSGATTDNLIDQQLCRA